MKNLFTNLIYPAIILLLVVACDKDSNSDDKASYAGTYSGTLKFNDNYAGVWTAEVNSNGNITLSIHDGFPVNLSGVISATGRFNASEESSVTTAQGTIDNTGKVTGTYQGGAIEDISVVNGEKSNGELNYTGTWYEKIDGELFSKIVITETTYAMYQYDTESGSYFETPLDEGTMEIDGNDITVRPTNGINESGKIFADDNNLIISLTGLSIMVYKKSL